MPARFPGIRLIVLDLDGTLIDSSRDLASAVNAALQALAPGTPALAHDAVRSFVGDGARKLVERSLAAAGVARTPDEALPSFLDAYRRCLLDTTVLYPGAREALRAWSDRRLAVLSNKPGAMCREILHGLGVADRFFRIYGGDDVAKKPDPGGLLQLIGEAGLTRAQTVMVGDSANDIRTGQAAGVATIAVSYGFDREGALRESPGAVVGDLREITPLFD
jgi:phosphoglycolate phosphatase